MGRGGGFTLIEMLVVITIIMILAAIIYPVYELVNKRAETVHCANNMAHLTTAALLYAEDHDGLLVPARVTYGSVGTLGTSWDVVLLPYHHTEALYLCLGDQAPTWAQSTVCYKHSYGINLDLTMVGGYDNSAMLAGEGENPSHTILYFEILGTARALGASYPTHGLSRVDARHNEGCNFAFLDGHVKWYHPATTCADGSSNMWVP